METKKKSPHVTTLLYKEHLTQTSKLKIYPSKITPYILIDPEKQLFLIKGKSSPEDTIKFYNLVFLGLKNYPLTGKNKLSVHVSLTYFNSSTAKCLFDLMKILKQIKANGIEVKIIWYYEENDEDMIEAGEDYEIVCDIPFRFVELEMIG
ncbi:DUF1987 domain-containing protein [Reichenbachiella carrageenanivorans]|uniref:DUF1987 domain-containing protein n=1 Tax=Reichenbachiella carrageenanivorans TaxID=2979869 RepID=A0ABY6CUM3_9BACT|nr:DUF1987 domain-containing protein [Reichenbachiella carrageenanivorans]UXX77620.1 DUF1987 domain-containing protein [Reichenbachiella carrageenanivorans]